MNPCLLLDNHYGLGMIKSNKVRLYDRFYYLLIFKELFLTIYGTFG